MKLSPNRNALNALVLWGILSPKQLSLLLGVSVSFCSRALKKLVLLGLAEDLGRALLPPDDPLYGRYYLVKRSIKIARHTTLESTFRLRVNKKAGEDKLVRFRGGEVVQRHYLFASTAAFWLVDALGKLGDGGDVSCFPESYLRTKLGWHRGQGPARGAANPRLTMVPDALVIYRRTEVRVEAELTPKSAAAYRAAFTHLRPSDDTVIYVYPDTKTRDQISRLLPSGYRLSEVVFGDQGSLQEAIKRHILSLFVR